MTDIPNRTLFVCDNYHLLRGLPSESVDLITTDPPFAKNGTFVGSLKPPLADHEIEAERSQLAAWGVRSPAEAAGKDLEWPSGAESAKFKDIWTWAGDVHEDWMEQISSDWPAIKEVIEAAQHAHSEGVAAYIAYMAVRLIECHRVLKPTGSLFLHCDHSANSYLRMTLDAIFGKDLFRNEIAWCYTGPGNVKRNFPRKHDTIYFYAKSVDAVLNLDAVRVPHKRQTPSGGITSQAAGGRERAEIHARERELIAAGKVPEDWWNDIGAGSHMPKGERTGYPTQKPQALAARIIEAASNEGDLVLDPFAGCAYTAVAAESLKRRWMACDISPRALTVMRRQFAKKGWAIDGVTPEGQLAGTEALSVTVRGPEEVPERDHDADPVPAPKPLPVRKYKRPTSDMPKSEMKDLLGRESEWMCWACGYATLTRSGDVVPSGEHFHLDHIEPRSQGGSHRVHNMALLCAPCNTAKGSDRVPLKDLRDDPAVIARRESYGVAAGELVDIDRAQERVMEAWADWRARNGLADPQLPFIR